jgi:RNA 2',3'-cyclic 3'-phosphodiesterase
MNTGRAFVAIVPPRPVLDAVGRMSRRAADEPADLGLPVLRDARWTSRAQWHLTMQFLGTRVDLDAAAQALVSVRAPSTGVQLGGLGAFPSARRATVVWLGVIEGADALGSLATAVKAAMAPLGPGSDERSYHAHLTLARLAQPVDVRGAIAMAAEAPVGPSWIADRLVLFESVTAPTGARYRAHSHVMVEDPDHP